MRAKCLPAFFYTLFKLASFVVRCPGHALSALPGTIEAGNTYVPATKYLRVVSIFDFQFEFYVSPFKQSLTSAAPAPAPDIRQVFGPWLTTVDYALVLW